MNQSGLAKKENTMTFLGLICILTVWYVAEIADWLFFNNSLDTLGILPRTLVGLRGIPLMPFLHGGFGHLMANTIPFLVLGFIVLKGEKSRFIQASILIVLIGGLGTWLIGRESYHIGASGLIYGYFGYVMARGFFERRVSWIIISILVGIFFGGMIFGVIPSFNTIVSWEGHLCGMLVGVWYGRKRSKERRLSKKPLSEMVL